jgi:hypothetical protein
MKRNERLLYLAPIFLVLSACSGGAKPAAEQALTSKPEAAQNKPALTPTPTPTPDAAPKIGVIREPNFMGCSVTLQLPKDYESGNEKYIFGGELAEDAQMNIDGRDVNLKLHGRGEANDSTEVGDRFTEIYEGENLKVVIDYVQTKKCEPGDVDCEATHYSATITVERNGVKQQIKTMGTRGC